MDNADLNYFLELYRIRKGKDLCTLVWSVGEVVCVPDMDNGGLNYFLEL
jgi:hypothetical protein